MGYKIQCTQEFMSGYGEIWTASHPALLGCCAVGRTSMEACRELEDTRRSWLRIALQRGATIPPEPEDLYMDVIFADDTEV